MRKHKLKEGNIGLRESAMLFLQGGTHQTQT